MKYFFKRKVIKYKFFIVVTLFFSSPNKKIKIGVIGLRHNTNIGNNLVKFAISNKLFELGYIPYIIGRYDFKSHPDISFIKKYTNLIIVNNFSEIKRIDYDILMVNSDQTWRKFNYTLKTFYDIAFLCFSKMENSHIYLWNIIRI